MLAITAAKVIIAVFTVMLAHKVSAKVASLRARRLKKLRGRVRRYDDGTRLATAVTACNCNNNGFMCHEYTASLTRRG